jgi:hypothetical protein
LRLVERGAVSACLAVFFLVLVLPGGAAAAPHGDGGLRGAGRGRPPKVLGTHAKEEAEEKQLLEPPEGSTSTSLAKELGSTGQVDPLSGLGIRNPVCDQPAEIRSQATRISCETDGTPETLYPASNYGFDVFIPTGVTHPIGDASAFFVGTILNGIWLGLLFVLKLTLSLLGLAFGLNPFADGQTMSRISATIGRIYAEITDPWLSTLVVCAGIWFGYKSLIRREVAAGVAGTLAAIAMLVVGLWVVHSPRESVGSLANLSNEVALSTISAPESGSLNRPVGSYAEAMSKVWTRLVEVPFAGLDFSDVHWALSPPPEEAVKKANEKFCEDNGALTLLAQLSNLGLDGAKEQCTKFAEKRYGKPKRVIDLYLRSSPNSAARSALWDYFDNDDQYKPKVAAQGGDGVITRLSMLALFAIGLLGAILLLAWLAIRLFTQAAVAFVLLLVAPFALFFPLLGDSGRRGFKTWGLTLLGAIVAKVIYAVFLSIVLLGIIILGAVDGPAGSATGFLLSAAFSWSIFLKRAELVGWMSIGDAEQRQGHGVGYAGVEAMRLGGRVAGSPLRVAGGVGRRAGRLVGARMRLGGEATRETARDGLASGARALADERYREAQQAVAAFETSADETGAEGDGAGRGEAPSPRSAVEKSRAAGEASRSGRASESGVRSDASQAGAAPAGDSRSGAGERSGKERSTRERPSEEQRPSKERYRKAKELISRADENKQRTGDRWTKRDLTRFAEEDRHVLVSSGDLAEQAHRAGYKRSEFEALKGPERKEAEAKITSARERDLKRLALSDDPPGRIVGRPRQVAERVRQGVAEPERREALARLRRERRVDRVARRRRNLSRGG